jgi:hypothetical protein
VLGNYNLATIRHDFLKICNPILVAKAKKKLVHFVCKVRVWFIVVVALEESKVKFLLSLGCLTMRFIGPLTYIVLLLYLLY